jgi:hypothetical protein
MATIGHGTPVRLRCGRLGRVLQAEGVLASKRRVVVIASLARSLGGS